MRTKPTARNPVSAGLLSRLEDEQLHQFVVSWDALEQLAVAGYRDQQQDAVRQAQYHELVSSLRAVYPQWKDALVAALRSLSPQSPEKEPDPFTRILSASSLADLQADWDLMRCFPQAREALNIYLLERLARGEQGDV